MRQKPYLVGRRTVGRRPRPGRQSRPGRTRAAPQASKLMFTFITPIKIRSGTDLQGLVWQICGGTCFAAFASLVVWWKYFKNTSLLDTDIQFRGILNGFLIFGTLYSKHVAIAISKVTKEQWPHLVIRKYEVAFSPAATANVIVFFVRFMLH